MISGERARNSSRRNRAPSGALRFNLLGSTEVLRDGVPHAPMRPKQRMVLAILLLHANRAVPTDRLIDLLWSAHPPRSAGASLQMHVSGLRRALTTGGPPTGGPPAGDDARRHPLLPTEPNGYSIRLRPDQLDLSEFHALARRGEEHLAARRDDDARTAFDRALALWRGRPVADLPATTTLTGYTARLEERRFAVLRQRIGIDLRQGGGRAVIGELTGLCARHPMREDLRQLLMVALVQADRTADALRAYADARRTMLAEGVEPGPALRATQDAVLRGTSVWGTATRALITTGQGD
ncbi:MAG: AfsR/SARP family transcriptional regulator [Saccharothrix sp.]|nr:AfsR/SARP family transcriptional regulator [Saccharothrix sp.]